MSIHRTEVQLSLLPIPPRMPEMRRCHCVCGCGRWWYSPRTPGRPPSYATPECYLKVKREKGRKASAARPVQFRTTTCACGCGEIITQRVQRGRPKRFVNVKHWRNARPEDS